MTDARPVPARPDREHRWPRWARWTLLSQPRAWLAAILVLVPMACTSHLADDLVEVTAARRLQVVTADTAQVLVDEATVRLPSRVDSDAGGRLRHISFEIPLDHYMAAPMPIAPGQRRPPGRALLFSQAIEGMDVYLNGVWVAGLPRTNQAVRYRWNRPLVVPLARRLLRPDGPNTVVVELSSYESRTLLPPMYVGSVASANLAFEMTAFIGSSMANASNLLCLLAGLFLLGAGWVSREEGRAFALAGALTTVWAVMFSLVLTPYMPVAWQPVREWLQYVCLGGVAILLTLFVFAFIGERMSVVARRALFAAALSVPLIYPVANLPTRGWIAQYWLPLLMLFYVHATGRLALHAVRTRRRPAFMLLALNILTQVFALHDHNVVAQLFALPVPGQGWTLTHLLASPVLLSHLTLPLLLLVMGQSLLEQMRTHVERIRQSNEVLSSTLAQRERELQVSYQRQREMENEAAAQSERDRIYRDLHDGIGSKLVTTLFSVREREITPPQLEQRLLDALKDLRETISETQPREMRPIQDILFGYASSMDEALSSDQFDVEIDIADGREVVLLGDEARSLLRIVEETVANTVKHAGATRLRLSMGVDDRNVLRLCIDDNGQPAAPWPQNPEGARAGLMAALKPAAHILSGGQGLVGMRRRAQQMGARYRFVRTRHGAHTRVHLPLAPRVPQPLRLCDPQGEVVAPMMPVAPVAHLAHVAQEHSTETRDDAYRSQSVPAESSTS